MSDELRAAIVGSEREIDLLNAEVERLTYENENLIRSRDILAAEVVRLRTLSADAVQVLLRPPDVDDSAPPMGVGKP